MKKFLKALSFEDRWYTRYFQMQLTSCACIPYFSLIKVPALGCYYAKPSL